MAKTMGAAQFKEQCLGVIDALDAEGVIITKHGKPVARLLPIESESSELLGALAGKLKIKGDILSTGVSWHVES